MCNPHRNIVIIQTTQDQGDDKTVRMRKWKIKIHWDHMGRNGNDEADKSEKFRRSVELKKDLGVPKSRIKLKQCLIEKWQEKWGTRSFRTNACTQSLCQKAMA